MARRMWIIACVFSLFVASGVLGDTPANCTFEDVQGTWIFSEGERCSDRTINCTDFDSGVKTFKIKLSFPATAVDEFGNYGHWTMIYNQGFEVTINFRKYFAFSAYKDDGSGQVTSYCDRTFPGTSHDVLGNNWACYSGKKTTSVAPKVHRALSSHAEKLNQPYNLEPDFIEKINAQQKSWKAKVYPEYESMKMLDLVRRNGGLRSKVYSHPTPAKFDKSEYNLSMLPSELDWRNIGGVNYVSPVRDQASCGSCYAFASMAMIEARLRIMTNNTVKTVLSPQDVVNCSPYSQGCEGGFPYLVAGKYGQDYGLLPEECDPYQGLDGPCDEKKCCRQYVIDYGYVGGFYGGCNEDLMKLELALRGPFAVSFEVYDDFMQYAGGVYHHTGLTSKFNPFAITNHAVLVVGYGISNETGEKYWIVKNSWGTGWGETGFFRIRRGTNECNIETLAAWAIPAP